jgi:uncharacterized protein (TIGR03435 family)
VTLRTVLTVAYQMPPSRIIGGAKWLDSEHYDITAKLEASTARDETGRTTNMRPMLEALLVDRFQLVLHHETRVVPTYALVVKADKPKLQEAEKRPCSPGQPIISCEGLQFTGVGAVTAKNVAVASVVAALSGIIGRPVVDQTGLTGRYDFTLNWTPDPTQRGSDHGLEDPALPSGPSIFTAVQEQLGLRLQPRKGPVDYIVIDRAERASEN